MFKIGLELTFVPDLPGAKEFTNEKQAKEVAKALLNRLCLFSDDLLHHGIDLLVKADIFRAGEAWIIEVTNGDYPTRSSQWKDPQFVRLIQRVFDEARKLRLYPRIRRKGIHHPAGGCHLHVGISDIFAHNHHFLENLALFEKNLYNDFANRPYIRWLFSEWFDNGINSEVTFDEWHYDQCTMSEMRKLAYQYGRESCSICARYSYRYKPAYPTYEFRFFDSVDSAKEIARNVEFLEKWIGWHVSKVMDGVKIPFTLTRDQFCALKNEKCAWKTVGEFLTQLGLDPKDFRKPFEENYLLRIRHGEMV